MRKFGLIGKTLGHSYSKAFFTAFFEEHQIDADYTNIEVGDLEELKEVLQMDFDGLNVTIPYKTEVIPLLDEMTTEAEDIGAVNVIAFDKGKSKGYNTDAYGFRQSIKPFLRNVHERAIIFGDGGAAKAIKYVLKNLGIDIVSVVRNPSGPGQFAYDEVNDHMLNACKLVINCTPVGTYPNVEDVLPIPLNFFTPEHLVVDLIYNPSKTVLLRKAEEQGAMIINGETMLKEQALKAWDIWNC